MTERISNYINKREAVAALAVCSTSLHSLRENDGVFHPPSPSSDVEDDKMMYTIRCEGPSENDVCNGGSGG